MIDIKNKRHNLDKYIDQWYHIFGNNKSRHNRIGFGGDEGDRTPYLVTASHTLSQMSYTPGKFRFNVRYYTTLREICQ